MKVDWGKLWKENWLTFIVLAVLAVGYIVLRTPGDRFASREEIIAVLRDGRPTVIEFYSNHCSVCLLSKPKVDEIEQRLAGEAEVLRLNVMEQPGRDLAIELGVRATPTFFVFDGEGRVALVTVGTPDVEQIVGAVEGLLSP